MLWFFLGGIFIAFILLAFLLLDVVYSFRVYNDNNISTIEALILIVINLIGLLLVLSIIGMFLLKVFRYRKELAKGPPLTPGSITKELGLGGILGDGDGEEGEGKKMKTKKMKTRKEEKRESAGCYTPPKCWE